MATELQRLANAETLPVGGFYENTPSSARKHPAGEAQMKARIHSLTLVLERLWIFYEAMRSGKPLANGDALLVQMRSALKDSARTSQP